ncbi:MAG: response regulator [Bacteroidetes bacterium]|nr:MAG: response regulator [Bacteroidota bacterium]
MESCNLKVFVVDDNSFCLALYEQFLINKGVRELRLFENGRECLNQFSFSPDIVLIDHDMPEINGIELLKRIKSIDQDIYVVMISAQRDPHTKINAFENGVFEFIPKDGDDLKNLDRVLDKILDEKRIST